MNGKPDIVGMIVKELNDEKEKTGGIDLGALRATRVPSKMKREMRRKYAKKYGTKRI
jgi:hypothetical protein